jgi:hypothetical protein
MDFHPTATPLRLAAEDFRIHACFYHPVQIELVHA